MGLPFHEVLKNRTALKFYLLMLLFLAISLQSGPVNGAELKRFALSKNVRALAITANGGYLLGAVDKELQVFSLE